MKQFLIIFLLSSINSFYVCTAQSVEMTEDTALINGKKIFYVKLLSKGSLFSVAEFSIRNMEGKELIYYNGGLVFMDDGKKAFYRGKSKAINIAECLVKNEIFTENGYNDDAKRRYLIKYPFVQQPILNSITNSFGNNNNTANTPANNGITIVERNREDIIFCSVNTITQDSKKIGLFNEGSAMTEDFDMYWYYQIKGINGKLIARATYSDYASSTLSIITTTDNKKHLLTCEPFERLNKICTLLVKNLYL